MTDDAGEQLAETQLGEHSSGVDVHARRKAEERAVGCGGLLAKIGHLLQNRPQEFGSEGPCDNNAAGCFFGRLKPVSPCEDVPLNTGEVGAPHPWVQAVVDFPDVEPAGAEVLVSPAPGIRHT